MSKTELGNFFEDFTIGQVIDHATPRTITEGDIALYIGLTGSRFALNSADTFAFGVGLEGAPIDDILAFHMIFGKTVPEISLNAVANLGYAECRFGPRLMAGDTVGAQSTVIGLKENSNGKTGVVYVRSTGFRQDGEPVLEYVRWVMVNKRDHSAAAPETVVPELRSVVPADHLYVPESLDFSQFDFVASGSAYRWGDYSVGEKIDHIDGMSIEEAEHATATRLYQNTAKVHFDGHAMKDSRFSKRLIYGGHVISLARALSFNGLGNAVMIAGINAGTHANPCFAGDTVYAWSEVLDSTAFEGRDDIGALRLRTVAVKDTPCADYPHKAEDGKYDPSVLLDLDYWVLMPR